MGIVFVSLTATDEMIQRVLNDPPLIWRLYSPDEEELYISAIGADKKPNFIERLFGAKEVEVPDVLPSFLYKDGDRKEIDLDKSWDGINFCLKNGLPEGSPNIFEDGRNVGDIEVGYGPAMAFTSSEVRNIYDSYKKITPEILLKSYLPNEMSKVYPKSLWVEDNKDVREYLEYNFNELCNYLEYAIQRQIGVVTIYT